MVDKIELEKTQNMYTYQIPPSPMELGQTLNSLIDYVQEIDSKLTELLSPKTVSDSQPGESDTVVKKRGRIPGKKTPDDGGV